MLEGLMQGEKRYWAEVGGRKGKKGGLIGTSNVGWVWLGDVRFVLDEPDLGWLYSWRLLYHFVGQIRHDVRY